MDKTRLLEIVKQGRLRLSDGIPQKSEGKNGDILLRNTNFGVRLYIKANNVWYYTSLNKEG
jgi:hypothetical protein